MWQAVHEWVAANKRPLEILGDSLTFLGGLLLAAEALWKKTERIAVATKRTTAKYFPAAEDEQGNRINPSEEEEKWFERWHALAKAGAVAMAAGFFVLLICRIFAE